MRTRRNSTTDRERGSGWNLCDTQSGLITPSCSAIALARGDDLHFPFPAVRQRGWRVEQGEP